MVIKLLLLTYKNWCGDKTWAQQMVADDGEPFFRVFITSEIVKHFSTRLRILIPYWESAIIGTLTLSLILGDLHFQIITSQSPRTNSQINRFETSHPGPPTYLPSYLDFDNIALHISDTDTGFCYQEDQQFECLNVWMHVDVDHNVWW